MAKIVFTYNGKRISPSSGKVLGIKEDPYNPLELPPYTVRAKFVSGKEPIRGDSWTLVDAAENIWDITKNSTSWQDLFKQSFVIEVLGANTTGVTSMSGMFSYCDFLTTVPLFDTRSVTNMYTMFSHCPVLTSVPLFDTGSVTDMSYMFSDCDALTTVPLFDTSSVMTMEYMFYVCPSLASVPLFNTSSVTTMSRMFMSCSALTAVPLFNTSSVTDMRYTFSNCTAVESGALALYQQASTQATPPASHIACFNNCGSNTTTGAAELAQIPTSWGGTMA